TLSSPASSPHRHLPPSSIQPHRRFSSPNNSITSDLRFSSRRSPLTISLSTCNYETPDGGGEIVLPSMASLPPDPASPYLAADPAIPCLAAAGSSLTAARRPSLSRGFIPLP
ncbi:hypothetical protein BRADI_1g28205v3, partial [Brachypodium distachyon]